MSEFSHAQHTLAESSLAQPGFITFFNYFSVLTKAHKEPQTSITGLLTGPSEEDHNRGLNRGAAEAWYWHQIASCDVARESAYRSTWQCGNHMRWSSGVCQHWQGIGKMGSQGPFICKSAPNVSLFFVLLLLVILHKMFPRQLAARTCSAWH